MKVLLISSIDFPVSRRLKQAGIQRVVYALAEELHGLGVEVTVCCSGDSDELRGARFPTVDRALVQFPERPMSSIHTDPEEHEYHFQLSLERARSEEVDLIHDQGGGLLLSDAYRRYEGSVKIPILTTLHGAVTADRHLEECVTYSQRARPNVFFNCVSRHQAELWEEHIRISAVIHNGIFVEDYHLQTDKKTYLFSLGRIMWRKGQDIAVEVAEKTGLKLVLAGPIIEPEYFDQFCSRIRLMPDTSNAPVTPSYIEEIVEPVLACPEPAIYIGQLDDTQKDVWFGHSRCFMMPIRWDEPFGLVLLEAMACGTPVVAFNRGGVSEVVVDSQTGFLVDSIDEMIHAVTKVDQIDPLECRRHVESSFTNQAMALNYQELYRQLLDSIS